jgi:NAD(P)-dependent dehydrogenase (short-subunit alcohol dehydrogenase family)
MKSVKGKKVLITGSAMGMGRRYAELAVQEEAAAVVLWDINPRALAASEAELKARGSGVHSYIVDVSKLEAIKAAVIRVQQEVGDIEILINNAGIVVAANFWDHTPDQIEKTMAINVLAPMHIAHAFLPGMMRSQGQCRIVNMASAAGLVAVPRMSAYCSSKWAAIGWSDTLRLELARTGHRHIRVTTVCPTYTSTGMFEGARPPLLTPMLNPDRVVHTVWRKMKGGAPFVTMPWTVHTSSMLKAFLPTRWFDFVADKIFGVYGSMDAFTGRRMG